MASKDDPLSMLELQQLCALNLQLCEHEDRLRSAPASSNDTDTLAAASELTEIGALSWLWVLGTYEVFRRAKNRINGFPEGTKFHTLNEQISEIRMVLAKREARSARARQQVPKFLTRSDGCFGWGYWDRRANEQQFFRAPFAEDWISSGANAGS